MVITVTAPAITCARCCAVSNLRPTRLQVSDVESACGFSVIDDNQVKWQVLAATLPVGWTTWTAGDTGENKEICKNCRLLLESVTSAFLTMPDPIVEEKADAQEATPVETPVVLPLIKENAATYKTASPATIVAPTMKYAQTSIPARLATNIITPQMSKPLGTTLVTTPATQAIKGQMAASITKPTQPGIVAVPAEMVGKKQQITINKEQVVKEEKQK